MLFKENKQSFPKCFKEKTKPHKFCPGCGHGIVLKELGFAIDELKITKKTILGLDIGCSLLAWDFFDVDTMQTHHGRVVPVMTGYKMVKPDKVTIGYVGDGGAYAIGLQSLIHAANRNDPITVIVVNNTVYGMTGGQMAPTTLVYEPTTTTPKGKSEVEKGKPLFGPELLLSLKNNDMFIARGIVSKPLELRNLIKKAIEHQITNNSFSFIEVLSVCPTNWKTNAKQTFDILEDDIAVNFSNLGVLKK